MTRLWDPVDVEPKEAYPMNRADVEHWLDRYRHAWSTDEPGDIAAHFEHRIVAVDADTAVIEGWTTYAPTAETPYEDAYANIWVIRFADDGRELSFAEWWVQRPVPEQS